MRSRPVKRKKKQWDDGVRGYSVSVLIDDVNPVSRFKMIRENANYSVSDEFTSEMLGAYIEDPYVLFFFKSLNDAKIARNRLRARGVRCGKNIASGVKHGDTIDMDSLQKT